MQLVCIRGLSHPVIALDLEILPDAYKPWLLSKRGLAWFNYALVKRGYSLAFCFIEVLQLTYRHIE